MSSSISRDVYGQRLCQHPSRSRSGCKRQIYPHLRGTDTNAWPRNATRQCSPSASGYVRLSLRLQSIFDFLEQPLAQAGQRHRERPHPDHQQHRRDGSSGASTSTTRTSAASSPSTTPSVTWPSSRRSIASPPSRRMPSPASAASPRCNWPVTTSASCPWPPSVPASASSGLPTRPLMSPARDALHFRRSRGANPCYNQSKAAGAPDMPSRRKVQAMWQVAAGARVTTSLVVMSRDDMSSSCADSATTVRDARNQIFAVNTCIASHMRHIAGSLPAFVQPSSPLVRTLRSSTFATQKHGGELMIIEAHGVHKTYRSGRLEVHACGGGGRLRRRARRDDRRDGAVRLWQDDPAQLSLGTGRVRLGRGCHRRHRPARDERPRRGPATGHGAWASSSRRSTCCP